MQVRNINQSSLRGFRFLRPPLVLVARKLPRQNHFRKEWPGISAESRPEKSSDIT